MDDYTIKTFLRPDFYEWFPLFSTNELAERLNRMEFEEATLLGTINVVRALEAGLISTVRVEKFIRSSQTIKAGSLRSVLRRVGFSEEISGAICRIPIEEFSPQRYKHFAYLNESIPLDGVTCLTAPGLIALMIAQLSLFPRARILDVGCGAGQLSLCLSETLSGECFVDGIDINERAVTLGNRLLKRMTIRNIRLTCESVANIKRHNGTFDVIVAAFRIDGDARERLWTLLADGGQIQYVRCLTAEEYSSEKFGSWLRTEFSTYDDYLKRGSGRYACLETCKKMRNVRTVNSRVYDVRFVPLVRDLSGIDEKVSNPFERLSGLLETG